MASTLPKKLEHPIEPVKLQAELAKTGPKLDIKSLRAFVQYAYINHLPWKKTWQQVNELRDLRRPQTRYFFKPSEIAQRLGVTNNGVEALARLIPRNIIRPINKYGAVYYTARQMQTLFARHSLVLAEMKHRNPRNRGRIGLRAKAEVASALMLKRRKAQQSRTRR